MNNQGVGHGSYQPRYEASSTSTIKNPSAPFPKSTEFNDRDRLNDMLSTEKWLTDGYNVFVRETSHQSLYRDILGVLNETHHAGRDLFNLMFEKGWYNIHPEQASKISKAHQKYSGYQSQFPSQTRQYENQGQYHHSPTQYQTQNPYPTVEY